MSGMNGTGKSKEPASCGAAPYVRGLGRHTPAISKILVRTRHAGVAVLRNCGNGAAVRFGSDSGRLSKVIRCPFVPIAEVALLRSIKVTQLLAPPL
jgi:hypothetical protein